MASGMGPYKKQFRQYLFDKQKGLCFYCQKKMNYDRKINGQPGKLFPTMEHLVRAEEGGKVSSTNIVLAHMICNYRREVVRQSNNGKKKPKGMSPDKWKIIVEQWTNGDVAERLKAVLC
jgi:5-methylcytosine-specific restriction endonuclease McrA